MKYLTLIISLIFSASIAAQAQNGSDQSIPLACNLSESELILRKDSVLNTLKSKILEKKELENGYAFRFAGTDEILDDLTAFIKSERKCCTFFVFGLFASSNQEELWLKLSGPEGTKAFIDKELGW